ncbi:MAG: hypothetical protein LDL41_11005 [Coleofasciculus sp. S288]|nr:hypothetical protein [Coleofasciculus sp. S288]
MSVVVEFPERYLRRPEKPEKFKVTGGIYKAENFLQEYGKSILKAGVNRANVSPLLEPTPEDEQASELASYLNQCDSKDAIASLMQQFQLELAMLRKAAPRIVQPQNLESLLQYKQISRWLTEIEEISC